MTDQILGAPEYWERYSALLIQSVADMAERVKPEPDDDPATTFETLVAVIESDPDRAVTVAATAIMMLAGATGDPAGGT